MGVLAGQKMRASDLNALYAHVLRYETNAATSCANAVDTDIPFGTLVKPDTEYFTVSGVNFTILKAGWLIPTTGVRMSSGTTGYELKIKLNGTLKAGASGGSTLQAITTTGFQVAANDVVKVSVLHTTGSAKTLETSAGSHNHIALEWRPL